MKRSTKKFVAVLTTLAAIAGQTAPAEACGGRGGYSGGYGGRVSVSSYGRPAYASTSYATPRYTQPGYGYPSSYPSTNVYQGQPSSVPSQSQFGSVPQRVFSAAPRQQVAAPRQQVGAQPQTQPTQNQVASNARPSTPQTAPTNQRPASQTPATQPATANTNSMATPEQSALQMLASISGSNANAQAQPETQAQPQQPAAASGIPQFAPAAPTQPTHVGTWRATLANKASIKLELGGDGQFSWTASFQGKESTFAGQYTIDSGKLTLVRAGDRQQLKGDWSGNNETGFNFKLDGAKDNGLDFQKT